jgi:hypothetical protein
MKKQLQAFTKQNKIMFEGWENNYKVLQNKGVKGKNMKK